MLEIATWRDVAVGQRYLLGVIGHEAKRLDELIALFVKGWPVGYTGVQESDVDVVEMIEREYPFATAVVDVESEVWGRRHLLAKGEVGSYTEL